MSSQTVPPGRAASIYPQSLDGTNPHGVIATRTDFTMDDVEYAMFVWTGNTVCLPVARTAGRGARRARRR